ncbi:MAG: transposase, partial [Planctomycetota bacterium]
MPRKKHSVDQIIGKLRTAEVELSKGETVKAVVRKLGIAEQTYYRWRKEYGGLKRD